jgi:hypothetical protein
MLGSQYYVAHPTVKLNDILAAVHMDMYLPLFPLHYLEVQGLGESTLGNDIRGVAQLHDVEVQFDKQPPQKPGCEAPLPGRKYLLAPCFVVA